MIEVQCVMVVVNWFIFMVVLLECCIGLCKVVLEEGLVLVIIWFLVMGWVYVGLVYDCFVLFKVVVMLLLVKDEDIVFVFVVQFGEWICMCKFIFICFIKIYFDCLKCFDLQLCCVIMLCEEYVLKQVMQVDKEIVVGYYCGLLYGMLWGVKDLFDIVGIVIIYGVELFKDCVFKDDGVVICKFNEVGVVLVVKFSLGVLVFNDIWFGGQIMNLWLLFEGFFGFSVGLVLVMVVGLVVFVIGSEIQGSIISLCMCCGIIGLCFIYGCVLCIGVMMLCWIMDKFGFIVCLVEDILLVLYVICGIDFGDSVSVVVYLDYDVGVLVKGFKVGYFFVWMKEVFVIDLDCVVFDQFCLFGFVFIEVLLFDWFYDDFNLLLFVEVGVVFEEFMFFGCVDLFSEQIVDFWFNLFCELCFFFVVDFVQVDCLCCKVVQEMVCVMGEVDLLLVLFMCDEMMVIFNMIGYFLFILCIGFVEVNQVCSDWVFDFKYLCLMLVKLQCVFYGVMLIGGLFEEGMLGCVGCVLEVKVNVVSECLQGF